MEKKIIKDYYLTNTIKLLYRLIKYISIIIELN